MIMNKNLQSFEKFLSENSLKVLILLVMGGIIIKIYFTPFQVPLSLDAIDYFAYSIAMNRGGEFPQGYLLTNLGWPTFLSIFFFDSYNLTMIESMNIQRIFSIFISSITVIPIYFLTKIFFKKEIAIIGTSLFIFDPRIIENSILGITDSLFIFFTILTILFIFYKKGKMIYLSFIFAAMAAFVRYEGLLLIIPVVISCFFEKDILKYSKRKFVVGISLFLLIMIPINFINYDETGETTIFSQIFARGDYVTDKIISGEPDRDDKFFGENVENKVGIFIENALTGLSKYIIWILIPTYIVFCLLGAVFMPKKITRNKIIFSMFFMILMISSIFAYGRGIQETRYLLVLIPIFILLSCYGIRFLGRFDKKLILTSIFIITISISLVFTENRNNDNEFEYEIYEATLFLVEHANGVNNYEGNKYVKVAELQNKWPELLPKGDNEKMTYTTKKFPIEGFKDPIEFMKFNGDKGLTHLVITEENKNGFFDDVFENEEKYSFLEKVYDSEKLEKENKHKIFKINYEKMK